MLFVNSGDEETAHTHQFDHLTLLARGQLSVEVNGETTEYSAPAMIYIRADQYHRLRALEAGTVAYCIHALRDNDTGDILDPAMIPNGVMPSNCDGIAAVIPRPDDKDNL